ncbi:beta-lactamase family protein [Enterococcus sp. BWT-B8]|uniref:serine hydrolase domain-containing protein n=1 Tax=Enterococcus sp. BWT-B8 TaxID=2885157 RepID=UPI001E36D7E2|nr:serine hydrolase domain-containing protein [Enterococcus sp. BWT-B8]MCB5951861.1 beta-lactamase family protein [Enterococcus sp. BWT-B8]
MYERTKKLISHYLDEGVFPGASFAFIRGESIEETTIGAAQIFPVREKLTAALLFDVASLTKVICTTTVVLQLVEEKKLCIDETLKKYYPFFQDGRLTIRHLLTHTSDINTFIPNRDQLSQKELIEAYIRIQSGEKLGKESKYTDAGTILLGFMLEELLGKPVIEIFKERVLLPLQMMNSCFLPDDPFKTVPTEDHPVRGLIRGQVHDPKAFVLAEHSGNAGLFTNLEDLEKFVSMYLNRGVYNGKRMLKEETILELLQDHSFVENHKRSLGWDLKWSREQTPYLFHTGYTGTFILMDILKKEAFIFLSNRVHPSDRREEYIAKRDQLLQLYLEEKDS